MQAVCMPPQLICDACSASPSTALQLLALLLLASGSSAVLSVVVLVIVAASLVLLPRLFRADELSDSRCPSALIPASDCKGTARASKYRPSKLSTYMHKPVHFNSYSVDVSALIRGMHL
jgi:hypothetical protein